MTKDEAIFQLVNQATTLLLGASPAPDQQKYSIIADWRIHSLAEAVKNLREAMGLNNSTVRE